MNENHDILDGKPFKVIVFGVAGVGKSALSIRYVCQEFSDAYDPTIEDNYEIDIEVNGCPIKVEVVDTAGNDVFRRMRDQYIKSGDGFLLVYSITDRSSSTAITSFHGQIVAAKGKKDKIIPQIPIILVGNKSDLDEEREVSYQDGKKIAATLCCSFFETSAKNDIGVDEVFANLAKKMRESRANSVRKAFIRDRHRFSLRNLSLKEKKCKEKLQAFRAGETKSKLSKRANGRFRGLICGARSLDTIDG